MSLASLSELPLFAGLSPAEATDLESRMRRREFAPQQTIVREGGPGDAAFLVLSGLVAVRHKDGNSGVEFLLAELGPGQMFGEMALITGTPRTASVVALEQTVCAVLERAEFERALLEHPGIALALARVMAERLDKANRNAGIDFVSLSRLKIDPRVLTLLPAPLVQRHRCLPIAFINNRLTLAMTDPNNIVALDDVRRVLKGVMIEPAAVSEEDFRRFLGTTYADAAKSESVAQAQGQAAAVAAAPAVKTERQERRKPKEDLAATMDLLQSEIIRELQVTDDQAALAAETKQDLMVASQDAPIVKLANSVLGLAIKQGASDIHIEPMENDVTLRYRIDGVLQVVQRLPKRIQMGLISRLKILSRLDISEKRLPQDGRFSVTLDEAPIDFRVSTVPGKWGEKVVLRILDKSNTQMGLDKIISEPATLALVREMIGQPYGIIYVTGPTGSGKTTTLYSGLAEINDPGVNISTAEDPIEYDLPGVTQIQANAAINLTFAAILRAFLRQDPDVILVGETRDKETAHTAVEAALTGHLVFTTLHTNSAAVAFSRLGEMGIEPFLISSSTIGVIAQRLARRLCTVCREPYEPDPETRRFFGLPDGVTIYRARGCSACAGKGVKGRVGIYEVMRMTPALRQLVARGVPAEELHAAAVAAGMVDLKAYAALLLAQGLTSTEEVTSVVSMGDA
jgi:type IV pilus assembly protein PilB